MKPEMDGGSLLSSRDCIKISVPITVFNFILQLGTMIPMSWTKKMQLGKEL